MIPMIGTPQGWEWILIFLVIILLFGAAKLPDLARGTGRALRIFKAETKGLRDDEDASSEDADTPEDQRSITSGEHHAPAQSADEPAKRHHDS